jgi:DNA-binding transcriptional LysR family regulator
MELESSEMIKQFIMAGLGIGFMGISTAQGELRRKALVSVPLSPLPMVRTLGLIYRKDKQLSRAALGFIDVVAEFARQTESETPMRKPVSRRRRPQKRHEMGRQNALGPHRHS